MIRALNHPPTELCVAAERGALEALEGSCKTAVGAHAVQAGGTLSLVVEGLAADGSQRWRRQGSISAAAVTVDAIDQAGRLGRELGEIVRQEGGDALTPPA